MTSSVMTVTGPVDAHELGMTLMHEHLIVNLMDEFRAAALFYDPELSINELEHFTRAGGKTVVECTNVGIGRDPVGLRQIAEASGVNVIMGCGFYRDPYLDRHYIDTHSVDELADGIVRDLEEGVDDTGIRAGVIGEIASDRHYLSAPEERAFRAAARAHRRTGVTITTHATFWPVGDIQLDLFAEEGVDPRRVVVGHCDSVPSPEYHERLAKRGAFVEFDFIRGLSEFDTRNQVGYVLNLRRKGYLDHIVLSQDICFRGLLKTYGGCGYGHVATVFAGLLRQAGLSEDELHQILVENPRRALTGAER
jgi:predicted metal-dependent phosphotriesterase family hydrolase